MHQHDYVKERQAQYAEAQADREAVEGLGWRERRRLLPDAQEREQRLGERLREGRAELAEIELPRTEARRELQAVSQALTEREGRELLAARLSRPPYIVKELGERPADPYQAKQWDRGVQDIEHFRREHGITSRESALGREGEGRTKGWERDVAQERLWDAQRRLGREQQRQLDRSMQRSQDTGRDIGMDTGL